MAAMLFYSLYASLSLSVQLLMLIKLRRIIHTCRCKTLNHIFICSRLVIQADHPCKLPTKKTSLWEHSRVAPYQGTRYHLNMDMEVTR